MLKQQHGDNEGWTVADDTFCQRCNRIVEMPTISSYREYYQTGELHGRGCPSCNEQLCDECTTWDYDSQDRLVCKDCLEEDNERVKNQSLQKQMTIDDAIRLINKSSFIKGRNRKGQMIYHKLGTLFLESPEYFCFIAYPFIEGSQPDISSSVLLMIRTDDAFVFEAPLPLPALDLSFLDKRKMNDQD